MKVVNCKFCAVKLNLDKISSVHVNMHEGTEKVPEYSCISCHMRDITKLMPVKALEWRKYYKCCICNNWFHKKLPMSTKGYECHNCKSLLSEYSIRKRARQEQIGISFLNNKNKTFVGVELEAVGDDDEMSETLHKQPCLTNWSYVGDGSINCDDGEEIELVSPAMRGDALFENVTNVCKAVNKGGGFGINSSCGVHIHLDFTNDSARTVLNFGKLCYKFEDLILSFLPHSRRSNQYCLSLKEGKNGKHLVLNNKRTLKALETDLYDTKNKSTLDSLKRDKYHESRYFWMNLHSYFYRGTIEIRNHSGTLNHDKIINWIRLFLKLKDFSIKSKTRNISKLEGNMDELKLILRDNELIKYLEKRTKKFADKRIEE